MTHVQLLALYHHYLTVSKSGDRKVLYHAYVGQGDVLHSWYKQLDVQKTQNLLKNRLRLITQALQNRNQSYQFDQYSPEDWEQTF